MESVNSNHWMIETKAAILVGTMEIWLLFSIRNYTDVFLHTRRDIEFFSGEVLIPFSVIFLLKWHAFFKNDNWKNYVDEFNKWPKKRNLIGTWIVVFFTLLCLANVVLSFYLNPPPGGFK